MATRLKAQNNNQAAVAGTRRVIGYDVNKLPVARLRDSVLHQAQATASELADQAEYVERKCAALRMRLMEHGVAADVNSLGELQHAGREVDRLCAVFGELQTMSEQLAKLVEEETK